MEYDFDCESKDFKEGYEAGYASAMHTTREHSLINIDYWKDSYEGFIKMLKE